MSEKYLSYKTKIADYSCGDIVYHTCRCQKAKVVSIDYESKIITLEFFDGEILRISSVQNLQLVEEAFVISETFEEIKEVDEVDEIIDSSKLSTSIEKLSNCNLSEDSQRFITDLIRQISVLTENNQKLIDQNQKLSELVISLNQDRKNAIDVSINKDDAQELNSVEKDISRPEQVEILDEKSVKELFIKWAKHFIEKVLSESSVDNKFENSITVFKLILIKETLNVCDWNQVRASKHICINRNTLRAAIDKYKISKNFSLYYDYSSFFPDMDFYSLIMENIIFYAKKIVVDKECLIEGDFYSDIIKQLERYIIEKALEKCDGNQVRTAEYLEINRNTLRSKLDM